MCSGMCNAWPPSWDLVQATPGSPVCDGVSREDRHRSVRCDRAAAAAEGEIYTGAAARKSELEKAFAVLTEHDFLEVDQYGASAKVLSGLVEYSLVQVLTPDNMRGRVSAINSLFIGTSNELGAFESGLVANFLGPVFSVVSGGLGTLVIVVLMAWFSPELRRYGRLS